MWFSFPNRFGDPSFKFHVIREQVVLIPSVAPSRFTSCWRIRADLELGWIRLMLSWPVCQLCWFGHVCCKIVSRDHQTFFDGNFGPAGALLDVFRGSRRGCVSNFSPFPKALNVDKEFMICFPWNDDSFLCLIFKVFLYRGFFFHFAQEFHTIFFWPGNSPQNEWFHSHCNEHWLT